MSYIRDLRKLIGTRPIIMTGVTVIVKNDKNHILLQKRTDSLDWGTIGGALELGETLEEAARRELFEEAGLRAQKLNFVTVLSGSEFYYTYPNGDEVYNVVSVYEAKEVEGVPKINDDEGLELRYFSMEEEITGLNPNAKMILKRSGYLM